jgi:hypothetical protein
VPEDRPAELTHEAGTFAPALRCLLAAQSLGASTAWVHSAALRLSNALTSLSEPLPPSLAVPLQQSLDPLLPSKPTNVSDLAKLNEEFLSKNGKDDAEAVFAYTEAHLALEKNSKLAKNKAAQALLDVVGSQNASREDAAKAISLARNWALDTQPVVEKAKTKWPQATSFRSGRA